MYSPRSTTNNIFPTEIPWEQKSKKQSTSEQSGDFWVPSGKKKIWDHVIRHRRAVSVKVEPSFYNPQRKLQKAITDKVANKANTKTLMQCQAPSSVINESIQRKLGRKYFPQEELSSFGELYEANVMELIHKYLEIDTYHSVAYVGPTKGSLARKIATFFCLQEQIQCIFPGVIHRFDIEGCKKRLAYKITNIAAEEYFKQAAESEPTLENRFDRIIFAEAVQHFSNQEKAFANIMECLRPGGKIMIIHRPASYSTLPLYSSARKRIADMETPYMKIINALQKTGADVQWELEHIPILMQKEKWLSMLRSRFPTDLEIMSEYETDHGIRELVDGPMKYMGEYMEIEDRLLFITASQTLYDCAYPTVQRIGAAAMQPFTATTREDFTLEITENIEYLLKEIEEDNKKNSTKYK